VAVVGLGGIGKTQLALELAYRARGRSPRELSVLWVPAFSRDAVIKAYSDIGRLLGVPEPDKGQGGSSKVLSVVQQHLGRASSGRWLLVLDNADDFDMWFGSSDSAETGNGSEANEPPVARLFDYLPRCADGAILITTRSLKVAVHMAGKDVVTVPEMDEATASQLLRASLVTPALMDGDDDDDDGNGTDGSSHGEGDQGRHGEATVPRLLRLLACLPLAIVQAAAYINANDITLAEYAALLSDTDDAMVKLLSEDFEDEGRYAEALNPVAATWLVSFQQVRRRDALAAEYLALMACVEPTRIPHSLLPLPASSSPLSARKAVLDAIGTLKAFSFITTQRQQRQLVQAGGQPSAAAAADGKFYIMHCLVHLAARNWLRSEGSLARLHAAALARLADVSPTLSSHSARPGAYYCPMRAVCWRQQLRRSMPMRIPRESC
jgi:hypothetical protein